MIKDLFRKEKALFIFIVLVSLWVILAWSLYAGFGHRLITNLRNSGSTDVLDRLVEGEDEPLSVDYPLDYYFRFADRFFFSLLTGIPFIALIVFLAFSGYAGKRRLIFYTLIIGYAAFWLGFILNSSVSVNGVRYFTLFDDAMISMRYAKNLAEGHGLVWNAGGARVEGYSNFLWTAYMALWHLLPIPISKISLAIQLTGLVLLVASLFLVKRIAESVSAGDGYVPLTAVLLTAAYQPISFWALKGMETSVLGFLLLLAALRVFRSLETGKFDLPLFIILGAGMLVRIDAAFLFVMISLFVVAAVPGSRKKNALAALGIFLILAAGQTLFRWFYYHEILPNTYYLKMTGVPLSLRFMKGWRAALWFAGTISYFLFVLPFIFCAFQLKNRKTLFLIYLFLVQIVYSVYVGGDAWEWWGEMANRYLCVVMPFFFIMVSLVAVRLTRGLAGVAGVTTKIAKTGYLLLVAVIILQLHSGLGKGMEFVKKLASLQGIHVEDDKEIVGLALKIKDITTPEAKIAIVWAGSFPYFSERYCIDLLGRTDPVIARQAAKVVNYRDVWPGHNKYDYRYSLGELKPDLVIQLWGEEKDLREGKALLKKMNYWNIRLGDRTIYVRSDSPNVKVVWPRGEPAKTD